MNLISLPLFLPSMAHKIDSSLAGKLESEVMMIIVGKLSAQTWIIIINETAVPELSWNPSSGQ